MRALVRHLPRSRRAILLAGALTVAIGNPAATGPARAEATAIGMASAAATITVNFSATVRSVPSTSFGVDITGYGYHNYVTNDTQEKAKLNGHYGAMRMGLKFATPGDPTSAIVANVVSSLTISSVTGAISGCRGATSTTLQSVPRSPSLVGSG